jgi:hypothetical protein
VLRTIYFNHQLPFQTNEIEYLIFIGVLTAKFHIQLLAAQTLP